MSAGGYHRKTLIIWSNAKKEILIFQSSRNPFEEIAPEKAGFSSERLSDVTKYLDKIGSAAFLALYDGKAFLLLRSDKIMENGVEVAVEVTGSNPVYFHDTASCQNIPYIVNIRLHPY